MVYFNFPDDWFLFVAQQLASHGKLGSGQKKSNGHGGNKTKDQTLANFSPD